MLTIQWIKSQTNTWLELETFNLESANGAGVYVIWHDGQPAKAVKVGQGNIRDRLAAHRNDNAILRYRSHGTLRVTWAIVPAAQHDGVERYLGDYYRPLVGDRFPDAVPIPVNLVA
jgi:hypothetical protein